MPPYDFPPGNSAGRNRWMLLLHCAQHLIHLQEVDSSNEHPNYKVHSAELWSERLFHSKSFTVCLHQYHSSPKSLSYLTACYLLLWTSVLKMSFAERKNPRENCHLTYKLFGSGIVKSCRESFFKVKNLKI
jgi:hypothetical protein